MFPGKGMRIGVAIPSGIYVLKDMSTRNRLLYTTLTLYLCQQAYCLALH